MSAEEVDPDRIIALLERERIRGPSGLAFDADGTLWSGDVGEDVYDYACAHELIRQEPVDELRRVAAAHGVPEAGSPSRLAAAIFAAYRSGTVEERLTCEVMTWSYAGLTPEELGAVARAAFEERALVARVRAHLSPILSWARREGIRLVVISASPYAVVEAALSVTGITVSALAAGRPVLAGARIAPGMADPIPYGPQKVVVGGQLLAGHDWLGTFGDNVFDFEMLRAARVGVAVCPKPALAARLAELPNTVVLR